MTSSVKAVINPELRNILLNEGLMPGFRLLLGVEDTVYVTLLFSLFSYSQLWWNSIVTYTASSTPRTRISITFVDSEFMTVGQLISFPCSITFKSTKGVLFCDFLQLIFLAPPGTRIKKNGKKNNFIWCLEGLHACCRAFARVAWRTCVTNEKTLGSSRK